MLVILIVDAGKLDPIIPILFHANQMRFLQRDRATRAWTSSHVSDACQKDPALDNVSSGAMCRESLTFRDNQLSK